MGLLGRRSAERSRWGSAKHYGDVLEPDDRGELDLSRGSVDDHDPIGRTVIGERLDGGPLLPAVRRADLDDDIIDGDQRPAAEPVAGAWLARRFAEDLALDSSVSKYV